MVEIVKKRRSVCIILSLIFLFLSFSPLRVSAGDDRVQTVRVGYYENEVFEEGASPDAVKTGYAYEYYRKLSEYTGWNYEYVYGSFTDLYDMLLAGDIDLLAGLAKRDDRIGIIGYPELPMGNESYILVKHDDDTSVTLSLSSLSDKKIGVLNSAVSDILADFLTEHSVEAQVVLYDDYESLFNAFDTGTIDILAAEGDGAYGREHAEVICTFGASDYYLCVTVGREDLLDELDVAQSLLAVEEPNYIGSLQNKYYPVSVSSHTFSSAERDWLTQNSNLKIGYLNNYLPYSSVDKDGNVTGIIKDILPQMFSELSVPALDISYIAYDNYDDMIADIRSDKIDAAFPVGGGLYYSEESGIYQSSAVVSSSTDLVYRGEFDETDIRTFAVNENNRMQYYYIRTNFPDAEIVYYPDIDACLMAVLKGDVGATTLNGLRATDMLKNSRYKGLYLAQLGQTDDRCFGVKIGNEGLLKLLNRGIKVLGADYSRTIAYAYSGQLYTYSFMDMVKDNLWLFLSMILLIAILIIVLIVRDLKRTRLANRQKSDFVSNMSHEIRTPITAIMGMNEMIQRESSDERVLQYSDNIEKAGESLLGIINDILDFSKIESGHTELDEHEYSLAELLRDMYLMIINRAGEKNLNLTFDIDEDLPVRPVGDMQKLRQVITNLLTNAVKYTEKGDVILSVKMLSREKDSFNMEVSVEDTGIGIKESEMNKLYSAFDRLDVERTRNIEGSGLGLAISRRLLAVMGTDIRVKSEYGKGSRFFFSIRQGISDPEPIGKFDVSDEEAAKMNHKSRTATFTAPDATIMVVDDTPMNLQVICGLLKGNDISIDTAESGTECISLFKQNDYDLIFLDQRMPNMDGVETLQQLKTADPDKFRSTPVVCLTANVLSGAREQMLNEGFDDYLTKPVNLLDMERMLLKYLPAEKIVRILGNEAPEENDIPEELKQTEALDTDKGIEYCGDAQEYIEALDVFRASVNDRAAQIDNLFSLKEYDKLSLLLHSIKSTSKAIGAITLSDLAARIEAAAKDEDNDTLGRVVPVFVEKYRELGKTLDLVLDR